MLDVTNPINGRGKANSFSPFTTRNNRVTVGDRMKKSQSKKLNLIAIVFALEAKRKSLLLCECNKQ